MATMADQRDTSRPQYPPPPQDYPTYASHDAQRSPHGQPPASRDDSRSAYPPPPDNSRQGQYAPAPTAYPPPGQWAGQPPAGYPPPPPHYYPYPPPRADMNQPPQPLQPDAYRALPPPYPHPYYPAYHQAPPAPAPRQRTAIACKYCRKRKIRCSGYDSSPDGRCQNCVRFNQQCLFHPVSSQAAFVPASAVYGPGAQARAPVAGQGDNANGQSGQPYRGQDGQPLQLYGAHGQPLGPPPPQGQPQYGYPPPPHQGYPPPQGYPYPPPGHYPPPAQHYDPQHQAAQPPPQDDRAGLKRGPPDDDPHNETNNTSQSPHPASRARHHSGYEGRTPSTGGYEYQGHPQPTSPATSTMSYQSYPPPSAGHLNGGQSAKGNNSPPAGLTPQSANGYNSPRAGAADGKTPPPTQPGSAGSSRSGMKVHEMLGNSSSHKHPAEQRARNDNDMLNKLDGKK